MVRDVEAEVAGADKSSRQWYYFRGIGREFLYLIQRKFFIIVILMYPMPSLTHMLDILGNF